MIATSQMCREVSRAWSHSLCDTGCLVLPAAHVIALAEPVAQNVTLAGAIQRSGPPSQHVSQIVWQREQTSLPRISTSRPPHEGQAGRVVSDGRGESLSGGSIAMGICLCSDSDI